MNLATGRIDAWDATLAESQKWEIYEKSLHMPWHAVASWAEKEFKLDRISRSAYYRFIDRMRKAYAAHRLEQAIVARAEAGQLASRAAQDDDALIEAYKTMAADIALRTGNAEHATKYLDMALKLADQNRTTRELHLKERAQNTKEETLKLAHDKFNAAQAQLEKLKAELHNATAKGGLTAETLERIEQAAGLL